MYKCDTCGAEFTDPEVMRWHELHTEVDNRRSEALEADVCPYCGSEDITEGACIVCGMYVGPGEIACDTCIENAGEYLKEYMERWNLDEYTAVEVLNECARRMMEE